MPELPEVEVTRLSFADRIAGARVEAVRLGKPLRWPLGVDPATLVGRTVVAVRCDTARESVIHPAAANSTSRQASTLAFHNVRRVRMEARTRVQPGGVAEKT